MPASPAVVVDGVPTLPDNSDSDDETISSSTASATSQRSLHGGIFRTQSSSSVTGGSRTNSMRAKPIKKIPAASPDAECSEQDIKEAEEEMKNAREKGIAQLHQLHLGYNVPLIKKLIHATSLPQLKQLNLSENGIQSLPHNIFEKVQNLTKLDLSNNKLELIPLSVMTLRSLETLLLDHNNISSVPDTYDILDPLELPSLTCIGLEWNRLAEFPAHLVEKIAPKLQKIYLCENLGIDSLPALRSFSADRTIEVRLDNRPTLLDQYNRGGYSARISVDWNKIYPDKVMDYVYLGSLRTAQCVEVYRDLDIKYVLTAGRNLEVYLADGMQQLELPLDDVPGENIALFFEDAFSFIDKAITEKKGVLLHCFAGLSRSVTVMIAYLMKTRYPMTMGEALDVVKQARPNSHPNEGFVRSLQRYEEELKKEHSRGK